MAEPMAKHLSTCPYGHVAFIPALPCRLFLSGMAGQLTAGLVFLAIFGVGWLHHRRSSNLA